MLDESNIFELLNTWTDILSRMLSEHTLSVLFFSGFFSATLLPGGSEAILISALKQTVYSPVIIVLMLTLGNALGGMVNYGCGRWIPNRTFQPEESLKQDQESDQKSVITHKQTAIKWISKYGYWGLLFSWLPIIGDPLCMAAGWLRLKFWPSLLMITIGKLLRYSVLTAIYYGLF